MFGIVRCQMALILHIHTLYIWCFYSVNFGKLQECTTFTVNECMRSYVRMRVCMLVCARVQHNVDTHTQSIWYYSIISTIHIIIHLYEYIIRVQWYVHNAFPPISFIDSHAIYTYNITLKKLFFGWTIWKNNLIKFHPISVGHSACRIFYFFSRFILLWMKILNFEEKNYSQYSN